ncbi:hypothetical protein PRIPAC_96452, partial [Pristionchus pacificus]|uniref:Uncharacterized protein n=1 Tax=Pristionchus pacificus TaxID=54126 RepID=A0A2A6D2I8_PRIPA
LTDLYVLARTTWHSDATRQTEYKLPKATKKQHELGKNLVYKQKSYAERPSANQLVHFTTMNAKIILFVAILGFFAMQQSEAQVVLPAYSSVVSPYYGAYYGWPRLGYSAWGYPGYAAWWGANKSKDGAPVAPVDGPAGPSGLTGNHINHQAEKKRVAATIDATPFRLPSQILSNSPTLSSPCPDLCTQLVYLAPLTPLVKQCGNSRGQQNQRDTVPTSAHQLIYSSTMNAKIILFVALVALFTIQQSEAQVVLPAYSSVVSPYYGAYYGWPRLGYSAWGYPGYAAWWGANKNKDGAPVAPVDGPAGPSGLTGNHTDSWSASPLTWLFEMAFTMNMAIEEATSFLSYTAAVSSINHQAEKKRVAATIDATPFRLPSQILSNSPTLSSPCPDLCTQLVYLAPLTPLVKQCGNSRGQQNQRDTVPTSAHQLIYSSTMNAKIILFVALVALFTIQQSEAQVVLPAYSSVVSPYYGAYYGWPRLGYSAWGYPGYAAWWGANKNKDGAPVAPVDGPAGPSGLTGNQ